jgi:hypothetical protein
MAEQALYRTISIKPDKLPTGWPSGIYGDISGLYGKVIRLSGDGTGITGDCTNIVGDFNACMLTQAERRNSVEITSLIGGKI